MGQVPTRTRTFRLPYSPREVLFHLLFWPAMLLAALPFGYLTAGDPRTALILAGGVATLIVLYLTPLSLGLKLIIILAGLTYAQQVIGFQ